MAQKSRADVRRVFTAGSARKFRGTAERPRLAVYRSLNHIYAQVIDDNSGKTIVNRVDDREIAWRKNRRQHRCAAKVGAVIAERAQKAGISNVVYDRGGYVYHGRVKALLDATRVAGLNKNESTGEVKTGKQ
jgi:large subunit ribosomal protein L18